MIKGILTYWERALIDNTKMGPPPDKYIDTEESVLLQRSEYATGKVGSRTFEKIVDLYKATYGEPDDRYPIPILLFPYVYHPKATHQQKSTIPAFSALCVPTALWLKTGTLVSKQDNAPFVPRRHLKPMGDDFITIGNTETVDKFVTTANYAASNWEEVVIFGENLVRQIMAPEESVIIKGVEYLLLPYVYGMIASADFTGKRSILKLYADITASGKDLDLPLLAAYGELSDNAGEKLPLMDIKGNIAAMKKHVGQMNGEFALSKSQRTALHHHYSPANGPILAINGPPGTGKTTLLQSIVASAWVAAALQGDIPPVIVACSTNNQAVTNIIESFGKVSASSGIMGERWLPDVTSYGLYCVSASKNTRPEYQRQDVFPGLVESKEYLEKGKEFFLKKAEEFYEKPFRDVEGVISSLKADLIVTAVSITSEAERLALVADRNDAEIRKLREDKLKALFEVERIKCGNDKLAVLQEPKAILQREVEESQETVRQSRQDVAVMRATFDPLAGKIDHIRELSTRWAVLSLGTPLWMRLFDIIPYVRDKWALCALEFYEKNAVRQALTSIARSDAVLGALKSMPPRIKMAADFIAREIDEDYRESGKKLERMKADLEETQGNTSRLESEHEKGLARLATLLEQESSVQWEIKSAAKSLEKILARHNLPGLGHDDIAAAFDRLVADIEEKHAKSISAAYREISEQLDTSVRSKMFSLATHYWEGQWIKEMQEGFAKGEEYPGKRNRANTEAKWRRYTKLTPLMVSTFHMAPANFAAWRRGPDDRPAIDPLYNYIDLLIIDEAGQVGPDIAAPTFALAKQAIVVGDLYQIEPVWSVTPPIDLGNMHQYCGDKLAKRYEEMGNDGHGISAASGSVMRIAQMQSAFCTDKLTPGMFLCEHRRCTDKIIQYCNELAYGGKLIPCRKESERPDLPHMGWAHISGLCKQVAGSRLNQTEADVIVGWISDRKASLEQFYNMPIGEIIAVVTPFKPQQRYIRWQLKKHGLKGVTAGTVHALQGAERKVVILSPVYDIKSTGGTMFFDRGVNMLNVAVSRAIDSFLVFGDTRILDQRKSSPSGKLAKHLFSSPDNEITDLPQDGIATTRPKLANAAVEVITSLSGHRKALHDAITEAKERVVMASPWITHQAIHADKLIEPIQAALSRGVKIIVYTDKDFNLVSGGGEFLKSFSKGAGDLTQAGVEVRIVNRVHNKDLVVDSGTLICGSFNWLSAVRDEEHFLSKKNTSVKLTGEDVSRLVADIVEEMEDLFAAGGIRFENENETGKYAA